jgi:hypothetical protein
LTQYARPNSTQHDLAVPLGVILLAPWELLIGHGSPSYLLLEILHIALLKLEVFVSIADDASGTKVHILL